MPYMSVKGEGHEWRPLGLAEESLAGSFFITTGAGKFLRKVAIDPMECAGIIEIDETGSNYRIVWGLVDGGRPSSEFTTHFACHAVRMAATGGTERTVYHSHTPNVIALSSLLEPDTRLWTRALWQAMTECIITFPQGLGVVPWMVPGGVEIAEATGKLMETYNACVWAKHGLFCTGPDFDTTFGLTHTIEKAAGIYLLARSANGGAEPDQSHIDDAGLRAICETYGIEASEEFLR
jgi:rhamnulose-1-phosphate aldolase